MIQLLALVLPVTLVKSALLLTRVLPPSATGYVRMKRPNALLGKMKVTVSPIQHSCGMPVNKLVEPMPLANVTASNLTFFQVIKIAPVANTHLKDFVKTIPMNLYQQIVHSPAIDV